MVWCEKTYLQVRVRSSSCTLRLLQRSRGGRRKMGDKGLASDGEAWWENVEWREKWSDD